MSDRSEREHLRNVLTQGGRFHYRCAAGGHNAVSDDLIVHCLWHGEPCIDWQLQVDPDKVAALLAGYRIVPSGTFILDEVREAPSAFPPLDWEADDTGRRAGSDV